MTPLTPEEEEFFRELIRQEIERVDGIARVGDQLGVDRFSDIALGSTIDDAACGIITELSSWQRQRGVSRQEPVQRGYQAQLRPSEGVAQPLRQADEDGL